MKEYCDFLLVRKRGVIFVYYDLYVDVLDKVGVLVYIMSILVCEEISIMNL